MKRWMYFGGKRVPHYLQTFMFTVVSVIFIPIRPCGVQGFERTALYEPEPQQANSTAADSLQNLIRNYTTNGKEDTTLVISLNSLSKITLGKNSKQSLRYAEQAEQVALRLQYESGVALSLLNIGAAEWKLGNYATSFDRYFRALRIYRSLGNQRGIAQTLTNLGGLYDMQHQPDLALRYFNEALTVAKVLGDKQVQAYLFTNMGALYTDKGEYHRGLEYYRQSLTIKEELGDKRRLWSSVEGVGAAYTHLKQFDSAMVYHLRALDICGELGDKEGKAMTMLNIADVYKQTGDADLAIQIAQKALKIAEAEQLLPLQNELLITLSQTYESIGNTREALKYHKQQVIIRDSLFSQKNQETIAKLQTEHDTIQKEQKIALLQRDQDLQTVWRNALAAGLICLMFVLALGINRYRIKQRSEAVLLTKNNELLQANAEILEQQKTLSEQARNIQLANTQLQETIFQLQRTNLELKEANEIKMKFLHFASHDVQTFLSQLSDVSDSFQPSDVQSQEALYALLKSSRSMHNIMMNVLQTNAKLEEENQIKVKLLSIVAHDLRNPLTTILGVTRLLLGGGIQKPDAPELLEMVMTSSQTMYNLIADLLDQAAIQLGKFSVQWQDTDVSAVCETVVNTYINRAKAKQQQIEWHPQPDCIVKADAQRLQQIVDNLLSNAIKFSPPETTIRLCIKQTATHVYISVHDEGPGLTSDDMTKIFGFFTTLSAKPTGGERSTGIGLSIVKKLTEAMQGHIWCESEPDAGATFIVELPLALQDVSAQT